MLPTSLVSSLDRGHGRLWFAGQGVLGIGWWICVFTVPGVADATLGPLPPTPTALIDLPLFAGASLLAAAGLRWPARIATGWAVLITLILLVVSVRTGQAGVGTLLMVAASAGSVIASLLVLRGRVPTEWLLVGPLRFRPDPVGAPHLRRTVVQLIVVWGLFLGVLPSALAAWEWRAGLRLPRPLPLLWVGLVVLVVASALGIWAAIIMARVGRGTPLPGMMATALVVSGPYRHVRNPMAIAGVSQAVAAGLLLGSWLAVLYGLLGSVLWNAVIRPVEEADLEQRFGTRFADYRSRVPCWVPAGRVRRRDGRSGMPPS